MMDREREKSQVLGLPWWLSSKEPTCSAGDAVQTLAWRREWQPAPAFLPEKPHRQRSLVGYSSWGLKTVGHDFVTKQKNAKKPKVARLGVGFCSD